MRRKILIGAAIILALVLFRFRWGVLGIVGIGPHSSACVTLEALNRYLRSGGSPSAYLGRTPLIMCAAENGSEDVVAQLIAQGADVNAQKSPIYVPLMLNSDFGTTALFAAVSEDHLDVATLLIEHGADINLTGPGPSPLNLAIKLNRAQILQAFLEADREIYEFDKGSILAAGSYGHLEVLKVLLDSEALDKKSYEGALELAARAGQIEVVKLLTDRGVPLPETLHGVIGGARADTSVSMTDFLLQAGVDINAPDDDGNTPLHEAVRRQNLNATQFLIDRGAQINEHNHEGKTPWILQSQKGIQTSKPC